MTGTARWLCVTPVVLVVLALAGGAGAADRSKVDHATRQVEHGAKEIGRGKVGPGFRDMFTGIGRTVVEGARFSGETIREIFQKPRAEP